eukprot:scaffold276562_cov17-Tisochrysis_lutea.AAC.1
MESKVFDMDGSDSTPWPFTEPSSQSMSLIPTLCSTREAVELEIWRYEVRQCFDNLLHIANAESAIALLLKVKTAVWFKNVMQDRVLFASQVAGDTCHNPLLCMDYKFYSGCN